MTGWRSAGAVAATVVLALAVGTTGSAPAAADEGRTLFTFTDPEIAESSGLVDRGGTVLTTNDSGAGPVLYTVDSRTGDTVGRTTYSTDEVVDTEALAPGRDGTVWVADTGDNRANRDSVSLYRVRPGSDAAAPRLDLTYPDGPRDAETLLAHPRTGRLFVVSKTVFGGTVYAVPGDARPGRLIRMRRFAQVPGLVTDGAFLPDGRHVLLRSYATATVYTFPAFQRTGTFELPEQRQGEAVAVGRDGRVLLSTEGVGTDVVEIDVPQRLLREPPTRTSVSPAPDDRRPTAGADQARRRPGGGPVPDSVAFALRVVAGLVLLGALWVGVRRLWRSDRG